MNRKLNDILEEGIEDYSEEMTLLDYYIEVHGTPIGFWEVQDDQ